MLKIKTESQSFELIALEQTATSFIATILISGSRSEEFAVSSLEKAHQLVRDFSITDNILSRSEKLYNEYKTTEDKLLAQEYLKKVFFYEKRFFARRQMCLWID